MNAILLSIQPQWLAKILNGEKTVEIRKTALHEGDEVHIYCTKGKPYLYDYDGFHLTPTRSWSELHDNGDREWFSIDEVGELNGKVVAKFIVGKVRQITHDITSGIYFKALCQDLNEEELLKQSCLRWDELEKYLLSSKNDIIYAHEITHLEIFDKPRELGEYFKAREITMSMTKGGHQKLTMYDKITHAPQSYMKAWVEE